jgi:hypothetical protein
MVSSVWHQEREIAESNSIVSQSNEMTIHWKALEENFRIYHFYGVEIFFRSDTYSSVRPIPIKLTKVPQIS